MYNISKHWPEIQKSEKNRNVKKEAETKKPRKSEIWENVERIDFLKIQTFFAVYFTYRVSPPNPDQPLCSTLSFTNCRLHYVLSTLQFFVNLSLSLLSMNGITSRWILFFLPENNFPPIFFPLYSTCSSSLGKASSEKLQ